MSDGKVVRFVKMMSVALSTGTLGGAIFYVLGVPLPWTLGSMTAAAIMAIRWNHWPMPAAIRSGARPVIGVFAGAAFTPDVVASLASWWPAVLVILIYSIVTGTAGYLIFTKKFKFDPVTAFFCSAPGGLSELSLIGHSLGGNMRTLTIIHSVRVVSVVVSIPLLLQFVLDYQVTGPPPVEAHEIGAIDWIVICLCGVLGFLAGKRWQFPGSILVLSMLASASVHATGLTYAAPPPALVAFVQILIGCMAGARFAGLQWHELRTKVFIALGWAVLMIASALAAAWLSTFVFDIPFVTLLLGFVPGGTSEMIVISYALGAEVAFVALCHVLRVLLVQAGAPLLFSALGKRLTSKPVEENDRDQD